MAKGGNRRGGLLAVGAVLLTACSATVQSGALEAPELGDTTTTSTTAVSAPSTTAAAATATTPTVTGVVETTTTTTTATSTATSTSTTTTEPAIEIFDPLCVVEVQQFDSLGLIGNRIDDETVNIVSLRAENGLPDANVAEGQLLDVCVGNGLDDITGEERTAADEGVVAAAVKQNVEVQQLQLNKLFDGYGIAPLRVDGDSGPVTRQRLCAARLAFGLPTSLDDMVAGSAEERALFSRSTLPTPFTSALNSDKWVLIDRTCQIMFAGEGIERLTFVFPTSTGEAGHETRDQDRSRAFRYDPARENNGWHDSTDFPVAVDNPLNGNMYKPIYFDGGQAIHGANNVPRSPQSKGCARLRVGDQDALVAWLGLADVGSPTGRVGVTVNVQGIFTG